MTKDKSIKQSPLKASDEIKHQNRSVQNQSLFSLTWPIFIDLFFVFMVSAVDAWFLSQVSDTAAASVGAVLPLTGLGFTFFITLSYAGASIATQRIGANDHEALSKTYGVLAQLFLTIGLVITAAYVFFASPLTSLLQLEPVMANLGAEYLSTLGMGVAFLGLRYWASAVLSSQGKTHINMCSTAIMTATNFCLNYVLVHGKLGFPALGVKGVAIASCVSWLVSLLFSMVMILFVYRLKVKVADTFSRFKRQAKPIVNIAAPSVLEPLSWHLSQVAIIAIVVQMGELALATRVYAHNIIFIVAMFGTAMSAAVQLKVAHYVGAQKFTEASRELYSGMRLGLLGSTILVSMLYIFSENLFSIFTQNQEILRLGKNIILIAYVCEAGRILNLVVGASLKAAGDAKYVSLMGFSMMWLLSVPLAWVLGIYFSLGLVGVWLALAFDESSRGLIALLRWRAGVWQGRGVYSKILR